MIPIYYIMVLFFPRDPCSTILEFFVFSLTRVVWSLCPHRFRPLTRRPDYNHKAKSSHTAFISVNLFSEWGIFLTLPFSPSAVAGLHLLYHLTVLLRRRCEKVLSQYKWFVIFSSRDGEAGTLWRMWKALRISLGFPAELIRGRQDFLWLSPSFSDHPRSSKRGEALKKLQRELVSVSKHLRGMTTDSFQISPRV